MENFFKNIGEVNEPNGEGALHSPLAQTILDSSLITATSRALYNVKLVSCGDYLQTYFLQEKKMKSIKDDEIDLKLIKGDNSKKYENLLSSNTIDKKNINRSKLKCQRLAKANSREWKTFITLTFKEEITDINIANKKYKSFKEQVQRSFSNFKCICVPEYMKNGRVHYHLLTNIPGNSNIIPKRKPLKLWNKEIKKYKKIDYYDIKYWNYGFSSAEIIEGDIKKIIGYISKYMTKDIDNKLFGHHRYFYTHNLVIPTIEYLDLSNSKHLEYFTKLINSKHLIYHNSYYNLYNNEKIVFNEFLSDS